MGSAVRKLSCYQNMTGAGNLIAVSLALGMGARRQTGRLEAAGLNALRPKARLCAARNVTP